MTRARRSRTISYFKLVRDRSMARMKPADWQQRFEAVGDWPLDNRTVTGADGPLIGSVLNAGGGKHVVLASVTRPEPTTTRGSGMTAHPVVGRLLRLKTRRDAGAAKVADVEIGPRQILDALLQEADRTAQQIHDLAILNERILATGAALSATAGTLIVVNRHLDLLVLLPVVFALLASHTYTLYGQMHDKAAYRAGLENRINDLLGSPALVWESRVLGVRAESAARSSLLSWVRANPLPGTIQQSLYFGVYLALDAAVVVTGVHRRADVDGHLLAMAVASVALSLATFVALFGSDLLRKSRLHDAVTLALRPAGAAAAGQVGGGPGTG